MLDKTQNTAQFSDGANRADVSTAVIYDRELNGEINRASAQGAKFALLLAMQEQNVLHQPQLQKQALQQPHPIESLPLHFYRSSALFATEESWQSMDKTSEWMHAGNVKMAQLWLTMHPEPLSLYENPKHLDEAVMANCSWPTQSRLQQDVQSELAVDETSLFDILEGMSATAA